MLTLRAARDAAGLGDGEDEVERDEVEAHGAELADAEVAAGEVWIQVAGIDDARRLIVFLIAVNDQVFALNEGLS